MQLFKFVDNQKVLINQGDDLFNAVNTHSGDEQELVLVITKDKTESIKNFMCELNITDNDTSYVLKKNANDENSVCYFRTRTGKNIFFKMFLSKSEEYVLVKPDKNGVFYLHKNWNLDEEIKFKLVLECEEGFSERFGEDKEIMLGLSFLGDLTNEQQAFV